MKLPVYEMIINEEDNNGVFAISLVDKPAIESDFVKLSEEIKMKIDDKKGVVTGAVLIPNKKIYQTDKNGNGFEIFFSKETIEQLAMDYLKSHRQDNVTLQHEEVAEDIYVYESWIVADTEQDKSTSLGFNFPIGTWVVSMKVDNDDIEKGLDEGELNGFSIEGILSKTITKLMKKKTDEEIIEEIITQDKNEDLIIKELEDFLNKNKN